MVNQNHKTRIKFLKKHWGRIALNVIILTLLVGGCSSVTLVTSYYLLDYLPSIDNQKLQLEEPLPYSVQVVNFKIPRSFDSIRIIARFSSHQINYYRYSLWAVRPQIIAADLLVQHINAYSLFQKCQREFLDERPNFEITGEIFQIERFESEQYTAAHLKMAYELYDYETNERLVRHEFDTEIPIPRENMTIFVKAISDILRVETEKFLSKVVSYLEERELKAEEMKQ